MLNVAISGMKGIDLTKDAKSKDDKITTYFRIIKILNLTRIPKNYNWY